MQPVGGALGAGLAAMFLDWRLAVHHAAIAGTCEAMDDSPGLLAELAGAAGVLGLGVRRLSEGAQPGPRA